MKSSPAKGFLELSDLIPGEKYIVRVFLKGNESVFSSETFHTSPGEMNLSLHVLHLRMHPIPSFLLFCAASSDGRMKACMKKHIHSFINVKHSDLIIQLSEYITFNQNLKYLLLAFKLFIGFS